MSSGPSMSVVAPTVRRLTDRRRGDDMAGRDRAHRTRRDESRQPRRLRNVGKRRWRNGAMVAKRDLEQGHAVMRVTTVPRNRLRLGTVVMARVPFASERGSEVDPSPERDKVRPVVVVGVSRDGCICRPCTSAASRHRYPAAHTELEDLDSAGLPRATGVKRRELVVPFGDCFTVCGVLAESDLERLFGQLVAEAADRVVADRDMSVVADTVFS